MVHVGRWIDRPQSAVQIRGVEIEWNVDASRQQRLKAIAGANVFLDAVDVPDEIRALVARVSLDGGCVEVGRHSAESRWLPQSVERVIQLRGGGLVERAQLHIPRSLWDRNCHDDTRGAVKVGEYHQRARENKNRIGSCDAAGWTIRKLLDQPNDIVAEIPDDSAPELTQVWHVRRPGRVDEG